MENRIEIQKAEAELGGPRSSCPFLHAWPYISLHGADLQHAEGLTFSQNNFFLEQAWPPSLQLSAGPTAERMRREAAESPVARPPPKREMQFSVTGPDGRRGRDAPAQWAKAAFCSSCRFSVRSDLELALRSVEALNVPQLPELLKLYYQKLFPNARYYRCLKYGRVIENY